MIQRRGKIRLTATATYSGRPALRRRPAIERLGFGDCVCRRADRAIPHGVGIDPSNRPTVEP